MGKEQFEEMDEEMTVELELDDGTNVTCAIITILEVEGKDYIVLMPLDENGQNDDGEVWFYRYSENPNDPNEEPQLDYIDDDAEKKRSTNTLTAVNSMSWLLSTEKQTNKNETKRTAVPERFHTGNVPDGSFFYRIGNFVSIR